MVGGEKIIHNKINAFEPLPWFTSQMRYEIRTHIFNHMVIGLTILVKYCISSNKPCAFIYLRSRNCVRTNRGRGLNKGTVYFIHC